MTTPASRRIARWCSSILACAFFVAACVTRGPEGLRQHLWWSGAGAVVPHDSFPADCSLCHIGNDWQTLTDDFEFDHEEETGVPLLGAHARATCLRCHNDRGPVAVFASKGCAGCHEDLHIGELGSSCEDCHQQFTWEPTGQVEMHLRTRFPLVGVHAVTSCHRCHPGAEVGRFRPTDTECVTCHRSDLQRVPNHIGLGRGDRCDRCHMPRTWEEFEIHQ